MRADLDFSKFPDIVKGDIFWRPPPTILKDIPNAYERAASSLHMLFQIGAHKKRIGFSESMHAAAYIRAALVEFVAIEESLRENGFKDFSITNSKNPLLHLMRLLRNYNVHVSTFDVSLMDVDIVFAGEPTNITVEIINNLEVLSLMELRAIKVHSKYSKDEVEAMLAAFEIQQRRLGAYEILRIGVWALIYEVENLLTTRSRPTPSARP